MATKEQYRESGGDETVYLDCSSGYTNVHMCLNCTELRRHIWSQMSVCKTSEIGTGFVYYTSVHFLVFILYYSYARGK